MNLTYNFQVHGGISNIIVYGFEIFVIIIFLNIIFHVKLMHIILLYNYSLKTRGTAFITSVIVLTREKHLHHGIISLRGLRQINLI